METQSSHLLEPAQSLSCIWLFNQKPICGLHLAFLSISCRDMSSIGAPMLGIGIYLADFYRYTMRSIFAGSFRYDNVYGASRFTSSLGGLIGSINTFPNCKEVSSPP
jgi:hypothetical protein